MTIEQHFREAFRLRLSQVNPHLKPEEIERRVAEVAMPGANAIINLLRSFARLPEQDRFRQVALRLCPEPAIESPATVAEVDPKTTEQDAKQAAYMAHLRRAALAKVLEVPGDE
jgi:hypothetical protein